MRKLKIGLDFDGVIVRFAEIKALVAEKRFGRKIHWHNFKRETVVGNGHLTDRNFDKVGFIACTSWYFAQNMKPVESAKFFLSGLDREGHKLFIVTSRNGLAFKTADRWLQENGFSFLPRIGIGRERSKTPILKTLKCDVYADDDIGNLLELIGIVPHLFLFSWPYNEEEIKSVPPEIKLIYNLPPPWLNNAWKKFYFEICKIKS